MALLLPHSISLHIPKTGGSWVKVALERCQLARAGSVDPHVLPSELASSRGFPGIDFTRLRKLKLFAFIRHPAEWYQSFWAYRIKYGWDFGNEIDAACQSSDFKTFVMKCLDHFPGGHVTNLYRNFTQGVDFIERCEDFPESLISTLSRIGENFDPSVITDTPHENAASRLPEFAEKCRYSSTLLKSVLEAERETIHRFQYDSPREGATIWLTGLPCSGKTTIATALVKYLRDIGLKSELLDGDEVRKSLCRGLGFSKEDRDENVRRIGFVCGTLLRNGVFPVVSVVSPYRNARAEVKASCERFLEVYVSCPLEKCVERDTRGLYRKAKDGEIEKFTGINDPYEPPPNPDVTLETDQESVENCVLKIVNVARKRKYLGPFTPLLTPS